MVTLCPSGAPGALQPLHACSERPRDVEDKIAESVAAEPFSLLADPPLTAQDNRPRLARSALVLAPIGDEMSVQSDVRAFHEALDIPVLTSQGIPPDRAELRAELIAEEANETILAIHDGDLVATADGLCDLLCVVYGAALEFGIDLDAVWPEVHRTNMAKVGGPVRADGKRLKPPGWTPPDIESALKTAVLT